MRRLPRVGFIMPSHPNFSKTDELRSEALSELKKLPVDILVGGEMPSSQKEVLEALESLKKAEVDLALVYLAFYPPEELISILSKELDFCPIILWSLYDSPKTEVPLTTLIIAAVISDILVKTFSLS